MNVISLLLAVFAVVCFLWAMNPPSPPRVASVPFGLALLASAWVIQLLWQGAHQIVIH
jgi:hypothetical protein